MLRQPVPNPHLAAHVKKQEKPEEKQNRPAKHGPSLSQYEALSSVGTWYWGGCLHKQCYHRKCSRGIAKFDRIAFQKVRRNEGRRHTSKAEEQVHQIKCGAAVRFGHIAHQGIGTRNNNSSAKPEHE